MSTNNSLSRSESGQPDSSESVGMVEAPATVVREIVPPTVDRINAVGPGIDNVLQVAAQGLSPDDFNALMANDRVLMDVPPPVDANPVMSVIGSGAEAASPNPAVVAETNNTFLEDDDPLRHALWQGDLAPQAYDQSRLATTASADSFFAEQGLQPVAPEPDHVADAQRRQQDAYAQLTSAYDEVKEADMANPFANANQAEADAHQYWSRMQQDTATETTEGQPGVLTDVPFSYEDIPPTNVYSADQYRQDGQQDRPGAAA